LLIDTIFIRNDRVILRDVDGSEVSLTAEDAEYFKDWLYVRRREVREIIRRHLKEGKIGLDALLKARIERKEKRDEQS
jgi:hypothetical protein